jgi:hypothetical protein
MHAKATDEDSDERGCEHGKGKVEATDEGKVEGGGRGKSFVFQVITEIDTI